MKMPAHRQQNNKCLDKFQGIIYGFHPNRTFRKGTNILWRHNGTGIMIASGWEYPPVRGAAEITLFDH
jgi:hypothetical protein